MKRNCGVSKLRSGRRELIALAGVLAFAASGCIIPAVNVDPSRFPVVSLDKIPDAVLASFVRHYPDAALDRVINWSVDYKYHYRKGLVAGPPQFKIEYTRNHERRSVLFANDGSMIEGSDEKVTTDAASTDDKP